MKRWSVRRVLVGLVAVAVSAGARHADAQVLQNVVAGAPVQVRVPLDDEMPDTTVRVAPRQWRPVVMVPPNVQAWRNFLAVQRRQNIARLRSYMQAGAFPENRVRPGRLNVFVDANGRLCAVANLLALSGHRVLVDRVSRANNFVRFADVATGPLVDWALSSGLTREEIVRIQEPYEFIPQGIPVANEWQAQQRERARLQTHFVQVLQELEGNFDGSVAVALGRLGAHLAEAPRDLGWDGAPEPVQPPFVPVVQPIVQPVIVQPVVYPQPYVQPYVQPLVVYPEPVLRPVRVNPYSQPVVYPTPQPVVLPVQPVQPLQVHVNVSVQANPNALQPVPVIIEE